MRSKHAIVMLSLGKRRTWRNHAFSTFARVAASWNVDAHLVTRDDASEILTSDLARSPGRTHKRAYALKSYYAWRFLTEHKYSKVLMVDDTCVIHPRAENIFDLYRTAPVAFKATAPAHARESFDHIQKLTDEGRAEQVEFDERLYGNTGVVLYTRDVADVFNPGAINLARDMLYARFPHQTLFYYLHRKSKVPVELMEPRWNLTPGLELPANSRKQLMSASDYISLEKHAVMHFTGFYAHRANLVENLADHYLALTGGEPPNEDANE